MKTYQKLFSLCALTLLTQAAFAQSVPPLGTAAGFAVLSAAANGGGAVTCTDSVISGDVGSSGAPASIVKTECTISGAEIAPVPAQVVRDFDRAYATLGLQQCTQTVSQAAFTGASLTYEPGVICFPAAATFTDTTITLLGGANDLWIFKVGTDAPGALTGTGLQVLMAGGQACNVYWWVDAATTLTTSGFQGTILSGAAITATGLANPSTAYDGNMLAKAAVTLTNFSLTGCEGSHSNPKPNQRCNQGVGNGPEACDPGNSNQGNPLRSNDELGGVPGNPGRKGGNNK
ncbi:MAG TPA: ice-binding family protein [Burkholderiales bacterium]|nr:ice-binding family protein [Burkholderiales bacterium]